MLERYTDLIERLVRDSLTRTREFNGSSELSVGGGV